MAIGPNERVIVGGRAPCSVLAPVSPGGTIKSNIVRPGAGVCSLRQKGMVMVESRSVCEVRESRVQHFVDLAHETPEMVEGLRSGSIDAMVDFFELALGAHVTAVAVEDVAPRDLAN